MLARVRGWLDRFARWPALAAWAALIFGLSSIPNNFEPSRSAIPADKIAHAMEFAMLSLVLAWCLARWRGTPVSAALAIAAVAASAVYGVSDELHQRYVPGRDVTVGDLLADVAGSGIGAWLAFVLGKRG